MALPRLPRLILAIGVLCLVRCVSEYLILTRCVGDLNRFYFILSGVDLGLALLVGGILVSTSIGVGVKLAPDIVRALPGANMRRPFLFLLPRLVLYGILVVFWPWAAHHIIADAPAQSRKGRWLAFAGALVAGGAGWGVILLLER